MRRAAFRVCLAIAIGLLAGRAQACGLCAEDKVAATYDAGVVKQAAARRHHVMFAALEGPVAGAPTELADRIRRAFVRAPGVDAGTIRVSLDPPAVSCAWDPARASRARIVAAAERSLAGARVRIRPLENVVLPGTAEPGDSSARTSRVR